MLRCCEKEENITGSVNSLRVSETFQRCLSSAVTKNLLEKSTYQLLVEKIGIHSTDLPVVSILLFPRAAIKQFIH